MVAAPEGNLTLKPSQYSSPCLPNSVSHGSHDSWFGASYPFTDDDAPGVVQTCGVTWELMTTRLCCDTRTTQQVFVCGEANKLIPANDHEAAAVTSLSSFALLPLIESSFPPPPNKKK